MIISHSPRIRAGFVALTLAVVAAAACSDSTTSTVRDDESAVALVGVQVRSQLAIAQGGPPTMVELPPHAAAMPVIAFPTTPATRSPRTVIRHAKDSSGRVISIGMHFDRPTGPPSAVYIFEDGRIRSIVSARYRQHGNGYVRTHAKTTFFSEEGIPVRQVVQSYANTTASTSARSGGWMVAATGVAKDAMGMFLPSPLHAMAISEACGSEWLSYLAATAALAAASAAMQICLTGVGCTAAIPLAVAWLAALDKWNLALDKLMACIEAKSTDDAPVTQEPTGGSGSDGPYEKGRSGAPDWPDFKETTMTVQQFIDDAIASGNFWCSSNGDHCVYYAA